MWQPPVLRVGQVLCGSTTLNMAARLHMQEKHIREDLRRLLPRDDKPVEKPAEAAFRQRM